MESTDLSSREMILILPVLLLLVALFADQPVLSSSGQQNSSTTATTRPLLLSHDDIPSLKLSFGAFGADKGQLKFPTGIFFDSNKNSLIVADTGNNRIQRYSAENGTFESSLDAIPAEVPSQQQEPKNNSSLQFSGSQGIGVDGTGSLYVADTNNDRIIKFNRTGGVIAEIGAGNNAGFPEDVFRNTGSQPRPSSPPLVSRPYDIAIDPSTNDYYITDFNNHRVLKFNSESSYLATIGSFGSLDGQFNHPYRAAVDSNGNLFVTDYGNHRVQKFDKGGKFLLTIGNGVPGTSGSSLQSPTGIAIDSEGNVYVADSTLNQIRKYSKEGIPITQWGSEGNGTDQFSGPDGIAVDSGAIPNKIFVVDSKNNRIQIYSDGRQETQSSSFPPQLNQTSDRSLEYVNSGYGIKMNYPSNFKLVPPTEDKPTSLIISFLSPVRSVLDRYREHLDLYSYGAEGKTLKQAGEETVSYLQAIDPALVPVNLNIDDSASGHPSYTIEFTTSLYEPDGSEIKLKGMGIGTILDNVEYYVNFVAENTQFLDYLPSVKEMVGSLQISKEQDNSADRAAPRSVGTDAFIELYNSIEWLSDELTVHIVVNQDTEEQASRYVKVVEKAVKRWSTLLKEYSTNFDSWNFDISSSVGYLDTLGADASKDIIIELTGDPRGLRCNEMLGQTTTFHPDLSTGIPLGIFTSCIDERGVVVDFPEDEVYSVALHEIGHSLGLGHAFNLPGDLMCSVDHDASGNPFETCSNKPGRKEPSEFDIRALLYRYGSDGFSSPNRQLVGIRPVFEIGTPKG